MEDKMKVDGMRAASSPRTEATPKQPSPPKSERAPKAQAAPPQKSNARPPPTPPPRPPSRQDRLPAMRRRKEGTTIAAVMKATGWQQHSVRGFFASVVQKKLRLKLDSKKIDGNRIYRIVSAGRARSSSRRPSRPPARASW